MIMKGEFAFLSNFFPCQVIDQGRTWKSSEHAYQAAKTIIGQEKQLIWQAQTAGQAKRIGQQVSIRDFWQPYGKLFHMQRIVYHKFTQNPHLQKQLEAVTEDIVEHNYWHDNVWGQCTCPKCKNIEGSNWLGLLLSLQRENRIFALKVTQRGISII